MSLGPREPVPRSGIPPGRVGLRFRPMAFQGRRVRSCPLPFRCHLVPHHLRWAVPQVLKSGPRRAPILNFVELQKPPPYVPIIALCPLQLAEVLDPCPASVVPLTDDPS